MAKTPKGCEVYMPVDYDDDNIIAAMKQELQMQLNLSADEPDDPLVA